jgi:hypothetical protein
MGAGNIYRHNYDAVVEHLVWRTVSEDMIPMITFAETELGRFEENL